MHQMLSQSIEEVGPLSQSFSRFAGHAPCPARTHQQITRPHLSVHWHNVILDDSFTGSGPEPHYYLMTPMSKYYIEFNICGSATPSKCHTIGCSSHSPTRALSCRETLATSTPQSTLGFQCNPATWSKNRPKAWPFFWQDYVVTKDILQSEVAVDSADWFQLFCGVHGWIST